MWIWFSKYAVGAPISRASSSTRRASVRLRASGFSQIRPERRAPARTASATCSNDSTRVKFGPKNATTSTCGTISAIEPNTRAGPRPCSRAKRASGSGGRREPSPATSTPRTCASARSWNALMKPPPTIP
jgi:hypothetical protein